MNTQAGTEGSTPRHAPSGAAASRLALRLALLLAWLMLSLAPARAANALVVDGRAALPLWPAVSVLVDERGTLRVEDLARAGPARDRFERPGGVPGNLGRRDAVIWLRIALNVPGVETLQRVFEIDYPALNRVDLYQLRDGQVVDHQRLGNELRLAERPLPTRAHAAPLALAPGGHELLIRVQTLSSVVLPITLHTPESFTVHESKVQLTQGIILGLALCMALYSLLHWLHLRDIVFLQYALLLGGNMVFVLSFFGIGALVLWPDAPAVSTQIAPMGIMVAVAGGAAFMRSTLGVAEISRALDRTLIAIAALAVAGLVASLAGWMGYRAGQTLVTVLGLAITVVVLPVAYLRSRRGERVAMLMLAGWAFYMMGAFTAAGLLRGYIEPTFWTQHIYPLSMIVEMTAWMAVLGLRVQSIHRSADRARVEAETLRNLAHTDALTGLPNRRGLQLRLDQALAGCTPNQVLAVYLLDLDGFKPVNDRWGHDVGDALLVEVGQRLRAQLRGSDVVARLGGDEFVVLAGGLPDEATAQRLGQKLLAAFEAPFDAAGQRCQVGLTVGYALAPLDGHDADELLKRADAAMYAGKQAGRRRVQRGGRAMVAVGAAS